MVTLSVGITVSVPPPQIHHVKVRVKIVQCKFIWFIACW